MTAVCALCGFEMLSLQRKTLFKTCEVCWRPALLKKRRCCHEKNKVTAQCKHSAGNLRARGSHDVNVEFVCDSCSENLELYLLTEKRAKKTLELNTKLICLCLKALENPTFNWLKRPAELNTNFARALWQQSDEINFIIKANVPLKIKFENLKDYYKRSDELQGVRAITHEE